MNSTRKILRFIVPLAVIVFLIFEVIEHVNSGDIKAAIEVLKDLPLGRIILIIGFGFLVNSIKYFYDAVILDFYNIKLSKWRIYRSALLSNNLGSISGAGMRYYLYRESLKHEDCLRLSALILLSSSLGLSFLNLFALLGKHTEKGIFLQNNWLELTMVLIIFNIPIFFSADHIKFIKNWLIKNSSIESIPLGLKLRLTAVSLLDWISTVVLFCYVCFMQTNNLSISNSLAIFSVSSTIAALSYIPGGLGSFDYIAVASFRVLNLPMHLALSIIAVFRMVNTFIPLLFGGAINLPSIIHRSFKS